MGGGGSPAAPKPDPAIASSAARQAQLGEDWLKFSKEAFTVSQERQAALDELVKSTSAEQIRLANEQAGTQKTLTAKQLEVADQQLASGAWQDSIARADRERYESVYRPVEDQFIKEASAYGSEENQAAAAATGMADVRQAAQVSRDAAARQAAAVGINPLSGRYAGIERAGELGESLAVAGAANNARTMVRDKGLSLKADVANLGRGVSAQALQAAQGAVGTQNSASGNINSAINQSGASAAGQSNALATGLAGAFNANSQFLGSTGIVGAGFQGASQGYGQQAGTLQGLYNNDLSAYNAARQEDSNNFGAIMGAVGTGAGLLLSDEELKEGKAPIPEGEALEAVKNMPVESWRYKDGVADEGEHIGTYAQDFQEQTGKGDGRTIPIGDAIGLVMKATQDLDQKVDKIAKAVGLGASPKAKAKPAARRAAAPPSTRRAADVPPTQQMPPPAAPGLGLHNAA